MASSFRLELVVTRRQVSDENFDDALDKLREIKTVAEARGYVLHYALAISDDTDKKDNQN